MKKTISLAMLPVVIAMTIGVASAEQTGQQVRKTTTTTQVTRKMQNMMPQSNTQMMRVMNSTMMMQPPVVSNAQLNPTWVTAQTHLITRHYPEAIESFRSILTTEPNNIHALEGLAIAYHAQGHYKEASQMITRAIALDPLNSHLYLVKGQILDAQARPLDALDSYLTYTAMTPDDGAALMTSRRAMELYNGLEPTLTDSSRHYLQGLRMLSLHQPQQAIPLFEKYEALEPNSAKAHLLLGHAYLEAGQPDQAISQFESAVKLQADNPIAYYQLGSTYEIKGDTQNATEAYRKFLQFAPQSQAALNVNRRAGFSQ